MLNRVTEVYPGKTFYLKFRLLHTKIRNRIRIWVIRIMMICPFHCWPILPAQPHLMHRKPVINFICCTMYSVHDFVWHNCNYFFLTWKIYQRIHSNEWIKSILFNRCKRNLGAKQQVFVLHNICIKYCDKGVQSSKKLLNGMEQQSAHRLENIRDPWNSNWSWVRRCLFFASRRAFEKHTNTYCTIENCCGESMFPFYFIFHEFDITY